MKRLRKTPLTKRELKRILIEKLPLLLQEDPALQDFLAGFFKSHFADRDKTEDEIKFLMNEIIRLREESERRWAEDRQRWEEDTRILQEHTKILQEHTKILEEHTKRLEEHSKILEEHSKILKEHSKKLEEYSKILEEHSKILREHSQKLELLTQELISLRKRQDVQIGALGARWGLKSERTFRNALKGLLEETFPVKIERYETTDLDGEVFEGRAGKRVELDLIISDGELIVAELKSSISLADVWLFEKKVKFFEKKEGKRVSKKIIISPMIDPEALEFCKELDIVAYTDVPYPEEGF
ncbi:MAG: DUF3782 domain-containing protein [Caldimicrobium sp.]|nr:DUF3782 domain-containing protein [Caldimicrobium sp.]MCX7874177.1 DUF3782 domain-containing protein [Caldimicrobium sp.]